ncbi:hypothetical protein Smp_098420 [Schistosoma mansoni]|nr:hypothetical protein Smp_098420 [Schistosoma mansoni]|eukprot:XP_018653342.1 hypothetical protein Smp_098420 [Schistosoma mansoni]
MRTITCLIFHLLIFSVLCVLVSGFGRPSPPRSGVNHLQQELKKVEQIGAKLEEDIEVLSEQINDLICKNGSANVTTVKRSLQPTVTSMQGQSSNGQKQPMQQQQQYYPSNMMMKRQMGERITYNPQQPMSAYSQISNSYRGQSGYGQPTGQSQMIKRQQQQSSQQPRVTSMQGQSSNGQKQPMQQQQQQYYPSNMMMKRQMGERITYNPQQPMSAYSQIPNSYRGQSGYGQPTGQSQMIKRQQQQSRPIQAHFPPQGHQQYGYPEQHLVYEPPQYYDNIGWGENVPDSYEPVGEPYAYDEYAEEQDMGDDNIKKREVK